MGARRIVSAVGATLLAAGGVIATTAPAEAAACTSPKTIYHKVLKTKAGKEVGYVDLEYSVACHSARAFVHSIYVSHPGDTHGAGAAIQRNGGGATARCTVGEGKKECRTGWIYDKDPYSAFASAWIDMYPISYELVEGRTSSY